MSDRPLECSHCQHPLSVKYQEISLSTTSCYEMCSSCPILAKKLDHVPNEKICCKSCGTSWQQVQAGSYFGCTLCYQTFVFLLKETEPLFGSSVTDQMICNTYHLIEKEIDQLQQALKEAISQENYEQAAWLRDQIKEKTDGK